MRVIGIYSSSVAVRWNSSDDVPPHLGLAWSAVPRALAQKIAQWKYSSADRGVLQWGLPCHTETCMLCMTCLLWSKVFWGIVLTGTSWARSAPSEKYISPLQ